MGTPIGDYFTKEVQWAVWQFGLLKLCMLALGIVGGSFCGFLATISLAAWNLLPRDGNLDHDSLVERSQSISVVTQILTQNIAVEIITHDELLRFRSQIHRRSNAAS